MTFANSIFIIFLIISLLFFGFLILLLRQIKKDGRLPQEKMTTLAAILFIPSIIVFALIYKGLSGWQADIQAQKEAVAREVFVQSVYTPLADSQRTLLHDISKMKSLLSDIEALQNDHPNHADLMDTIRKQWRNGLGLLYRNYSETDKEIRLAWIAHNRLDQQDVLNKFAKKAVLLTSRTQKAEKDYQLGIREAQSDLVKNIDQARWLLTSYRKPPKSKKQRQKNQQLREKIRPFSDRTKADLLAYLESIDPRLKSELDTFQNLIQIAGQQSVVLKEYLLKNPDLKKPLTLIITKWNNLETASQEVLKHILYAIESEYIAVKLGLSLDNPAIKAMHKSMLLNIPAIVAKGIKQKKEIDQSYKITF